MKTMFLSAAAIAMVSAAPAFAQSAQYNPGTNLSGGDGVGTYYIQGSAANFCQLGPINAASASSGTNATVDYTTANTSGYSGGTSDAKINITKLQDANDHAAAWAANINMQNSVCNTAYTVKATSEFGGLQYQGQQTGSGDFTRKLEYTLAASFENHVGSPKTARNLADGATLLNSGKATAGTFELKFNGAADSSKYLLSGDYTDRVVVTMSPNTGTAA